MSKAYIIPLLAVLYIDMEVTLFYCTRIPAMILVTEQQKGKGGDAGKE